MLVVLVAEAAAVGIKGHAASILDGLILVATILFWSLVVDAISYRWPSLGRILKSRPRLLISNGEVNHAVRRRELMTSEEVLAQLRLHGIKRLAEVERAYIEPNGLISVVRTDELEPNEPVRPETMD